MINHNVNFRQTMITLWFQRIERGRRMADVDADVETLGRTEAMLVVEGEMGEVLGVGAGEGTGEVRGGEGTTVAAIAKTPGTVKNAGAQPCDPC